MSCLSDEEMFLYAKRKANECMEALVLDRTLDGMNLPAELANPNGRDELRHRAAEWTVLADFYRPWRVTR